ncbi:larval cuticle protein 2-like [Procambarus clarkii]|uniref:larval cuticle protein 2-like n=1 Tax=Procambarus clarkii TaxID=6728 RepID=UPI001E670644|nr:larval cuticle protein 2-like [Procambarus clarkii]
MKLAVLVLLGVVALVAARPDTLLDLDDIHHDLDIADDSSVSGSYSWTSPDGNQHFVKYVADEDGYRIVESNVVPATAEGTKADGSQGSFVSLEDLEDFDKK